MAGRRLLVFAAVLVVLQLLVAGFAGDRKSVV